MGNGLDYKYHVVVYMPIEIGISEIFERVP